MSAMAKLIYRFYLKPKDFTWLELVKLLNHYGFEEISNGKTGGLRRKFVNCDKDIISLHEPYPGNILKIYQIDLIIEQLNKML